MDLAQTLGCSIISADSRQVYREMSIGTAKASEEDLKRVKHYCVNTTSIAEVYSAGQFEVDSDQAVKEAFESSDFVIMCGGTGLYINAFLKGLDQFPDISDEAKIKVAQIYAHDGITGLQSTLQQIDPQYFEQVDTSNSRRITRALEVYYSSDKPFSFWLNQRTEKQHDYRIIPLWLNMGREKLYQRINQRTHQMIDAGWMEEVQSLMPYRKNRALDTVGYKELFAYLDGAIDLDMAIVEIQKNTRRYAKRQLTWFSNQYQGECLMVDEGTSSQKPAILDMIAGK